MGSTEHGKLIRSTETVQASNDPSKVTGAEVGKVKSQLLVQFSGRKIRMGLLERRKGSLNAEWHE